MIRNIDDTDLINDVVKIIKSAGIVVIPTDTIYGLICDASSDKAIKSLYELKKRGSKKPLAILSKDVNRAKEVLVFSDKASKLAGIFMPGPITMVLNKKDDSGLSSFLNQESNTIGLRVINSSFCKNLFDNFNGFLALTSANLAGQNPLTSAKDVEQCFGANVDLIVDAGIINNKASTVIEIIDNRINILREGVISKTDILNKL